MLAYQLFMLYTYTQFEGSAWLNYEEAFRPDAAAWKIND